MDEAKRLCYNGGMNGWYAILAAGVAWLIAQSWKTIAGFVEGRKSARKMSLGEMVDYMTRSGGMPSGHSACMVALTAYLGMWCGFDSALFALALAMTMIVLYDATHVRYAVGEQGKVLNEMLVKEGKKPLKVVEGHTVLQVIVGSAIGLIIGVIVGILTKP